ncbi:hypothetical protein GTQ34_09625 [Muricauda sp. JGD-17]|uniref:Uncharacterized protein n=1 Tax=Flagellimonas ochracea TaxID=2696472 RepID=A0A964TDV0_9FLAO|nr:hypothetical protein [Allomuricauda ochracea]NAY92178.1 hypothetical protein [Allomuricauda ochracea]
MNIILNTRTKLILTATATLFMLGMLLLEHSKGGVNSYHPLGNKDLPKISNWLSLLMIPVFSWLTLSSLQKRNRSENNKQKPISKSQFYSFMGAVLFGILTTIAFYGQLGINSYLLVLTFVLALFIPIYRAEYYLGYVLGMIYGFGGVLPILFGGVSIIIYLIEYKLIRRGLLFVFNKLKS